MKRSSRRSLSYYFKTRSMKKMKHKCQIGENDRCDTCEYALVDPFEEPCFSCREADCPLNKVQIPCKGCQWEAGDES